MSRQDWFEKLENLILDENRTMTYKILSRELNIPISKAKEYLCEFLTIQTSKSVSLKCTYFLSGITDVDGIKSVKVFIVTDESLEKTKLSLSKVTSCHLYSVGRGILDECSLYTLEKLCNFQCLDYPNLLPIKHPNIVIKAPILSKNLLKNEKQQKQPISTKKVQSPAKNELPHPQNNVKETDSHSAKSNTESKKPKPNALTSMWQKNEDKQKGKSENAVTEKQKPKSPQKNKQPTPKNNILSMFSRQAEKAAVNEKKITPVSSTEKEVITPKDVVKKTVSSPIKKKNESKSAKRKSSQRKSKKSSDNDSDEDFKPSKKKHRRICTFDDSDSESESEEAQDRARRCSDPEPMDESPIPATPAATPGSDDSEEPIPPTPPVLQAKGKKKLWKSVQKTFQDDDGFFVTKQEKVLVSESESDGENPIPQKSPSKEVKKTNQLTYKKQASLTQFFKQK